MQLIYTKIAKSTTLRAVYNPQKSLEHSHYTIQDLANILITNNIKSFEILPNNHTAKKYAQLLNTNINHVKYLQESDLE
ncbi:hypothetical protein GW750_04935 [bacterium]|nr:hypothetical protein [bacterium]